MAYMKDNFYMKSPIKCPIGMKKHLKLMRSNLAQAIKHHRKAIRNGDPDILCTLHKGYVDGALHQLENAYMLVRDLESERKLLEMKLEFR